MRRDSSVLKRINRINAENLPSQSNRPTIDRAVGAREAFEAIPVPTKRSDVCHGIGSSQKCADQDRTNRNPYSREGARQKTGLSCGADATPQARMQVRISNAPRHHCFDASHLPLQGTPPRSTIPFA